jgi:endonuclease-3
MHADTSKKKTPRSAGGGRPRARSKQSSARIDKLIADIAGSLGVDSLPSVSRIARENRDPFRVLVSTVISLRTKDEVTDEASRRLFALADTPQALTSLNVRTIEKAIYPAGFYKTKARTLKEISRRLVDRYGGRVPDTVDELLAFKGVGRKTATLVVSMGYGKPAICVDTHVHRVSNRLGLVETSNPTETEFELMALLPRRYWIGYNELLVRFGQRVCKPVSPHCSDCPVKRRCPRIGVGVHR